MERKFHSQNDSESSQGLIEDVSKAYEMAMAGKADREEAALLKRELLDWERAMYVVNEANELEQKRINLIHQVNDNILDDINDLTYQIYDLLATIDFQKIGNQIKKVCPRDADQINNHPLVSSSYVGDILRNYLKKQVEEGIDPSVLIEEYETAAEASENLTGLIYDQPPSPAFIKQWGLESKTAHEIAGTVSEFEYDTECGERQITWLEKIKNSVNVRTASQKGFTETEIIQIGGKEIYDEFMGPHIDRNPFVDYFSSDPQQDPTDLYPYHLTIEKMLNGLEEEAIKNFDLKLGMIQELKIKNSKMSQDEKTTLGDIVDLYKKVFELTFIEPVKTEIQDKKEFIKILKKARI